MRINPHFMWAINKWTYSKFYSIQIWAGYNRTTLVVNRVSLSQIYSGHAWSLYMAWIELLVLQLLQRLYHNENDKRETGKNVTVHRINKSLYPGIYGFNVRWCQNWTKVIIVDILNLKELAYLRIWNLC